MKETVKKLAAEQKEYIREYRHYLHENAELSFKEYETSRFIKEKLTEFGVKLADGITGTSVVGIIEGSQPGPTIAFRADFDALPVQEEVDLPFKSKNPGVMHSCGHDAHAATLLAFAKVLTSHPELVKGRVKLIFQSAEELLPGGAIQLVKDGVMEDVDMIYGYHSAAGRPLGEVVVNDGPVSASSNTYDICIHGKGGHGSNNSKCLNPVIVAAMIINAINQLKTEKVDPAEVATVLIAYMHAGDAPNIIADEAHIGGGVRAQKTEVALELLKQIEQTAKGICAAWGTDCDVDIIVGYPANINDHDVCEIARAAIAEIGYPTITEAPGLGGEDFAYYAQKKPSCFFNVGGSNPEDPSTYARHHSPDFKLDEHMLDIALECEIAVYMRTVS